jgi:hypothetical protein
MTNNDKIWATSDRTMGVSFESSGNAGEKIFPEKCRGKSGTSMSRVADPPLAEYFTQLEDNIREHPENLESILTELHCLLNKFDPLAKRAGQQWPLVLEGFRPKEVLQRIREISKCPELNVPQIRFKADQLSRHQRIPLPTATRNHKGPLLQWFHIHWDALADDIATWSGSEIQSAD